jgi:uncharacterized protein YkwD
MALTYIILLISFFITPPAECISAAEKELYERINDYRKTKNLSPIPISAKLNAVARAHAWDLAENYTFDVNNKCNPHSWSDKGPWTPCCYTNDHAQAECMWQKPKEIAGYEGSGYEIAFYNSNEAQPDKALEGWKSSKSHNPIIINQGMWKQVKWNAIGIGIYKNYAVVWFGENRDSTDVDYCR